MRIQHSAEQWCAIEHRHIAHWIDHHGDWLDIIFHQRRPAHEPFGEAARTVSELSPGEWRDHLGAAARVEEGIDPDVRVAFAVSSFDARDSVLYAWAASAESPVDAVGFILRPTREGGRSLIERREIAARWMEASGSASAKEHWVFGVAGLPIAHGERSQQQAVWGTVAWATETPLIRGVIIADATVQVHLGVLLQRRTIGRRRGSGRRWGGSGRRWRRRSGRRGW